MPILEAPARASNVPHNTSAPLTAAGLPWYARASYSRVLEVMDDRDALPECYDHWLARAELAIERAQGLGLRTLKAHLDPDQFLVWCEWHDLSPDSHARLAFVEATLAGPGLHGRC